MNIENGNMEINIVLVLIEREIYFVSLVANHIITLCNTNGTVSSLDKMSFQRSH